MSRIYILIFFINIYNYSFSANYYSIYDGGGASGDWSDGNYWSLSAGGSACGCVPSPFDNIFIQADINLDIDLIGGDALSGTLTIEAGSSLTTATNDILVKAGATLNIYGTLEVMDLEFSNGCFVYADELSEIIVHGNFTNKNNSDDVVINGMVDVTGEFYNGNGGIISGTGTISAGSFTGAGTTFGINPNSSIPDGSVIPFPLPVDLIYFNASFLDNNSVEIAWTTASEINNDYFSILRSTDGIIYETIKIIDGMNNSNTPINYSYIDTNPVSGVSYYRLKQTDIDGDIMFSEIVSVSNLKLNFKGEYIILVFPNPASDRITVSSSTGINSIDILNIQTSTVSTINNFNQKNSTTIDISSLQKGAYLLRIHTGDQIYIEKIIVN